MIDVLTIVSLAGIVGIISTLPYILLRGNQKDYNKEHYFLHIGAALAILGMTGLSIVEHALIFYSLFLLCASLLIIGLLSFKGIRDTYFPEFKAAYFSVVVLFITAVVFVVDKFFLL